MTEAHDDFSDEEYEIQLIIANPRFHKRIFKLRERFGIPKDGFKDNKSEYAKKDEYSEDDLAAIKHEIYEIINDFEVLSGRWYDVLRIYLFNNNPYMMRAQSPYVLRYEYEGDVKNPKNIHTVWVSVDADTTEANIIEAFNATKGMVKTKKKKQKITYLKDAFKAKELREINNLRWREVAYEVNKRYGGRTKYDDNSIQKLVKQLNDRLQ